MNVVIDRVASVGAQSGSATLK